MSTGRFAQRGWAYQGFAFRTWGLAGGVAESVTDPAQAGWISRSADRLSVAPVECRLAISSPQQRVWIARSDNE